MGRIELLRATYPKGHPLLSQALGNLATALDDAGDHEAASAMFDESLKMKIALLGEDHFSVVGTLSTMTWRSVQQKDTASALAYGARAWAGAQKLSSENPSISYAAITYAQALMLANRPREALPLVEAALKMRKATLPADSAYLSNTESYCESFTGKLRNERAVLSQRPVKTKGPSISVRPRTAGVDVQRPRATRSLMSHLESHNHPYVGMDRRVFA